MTYNQNHDRCYWRGQETKRLIEAARDSNHEIAIALGERLEDLEGADDALTDLHIECRELEQRNDALRAEIEALYASRAD